MESAYTLYLATNIVNGKQYVGLSKEYKKRLISHKCAKTNSEFHTAIRKYGFNSFIFSHIADAFDKQAACNLERMLISQHNTLSPNGYNLTVGGQVSPVGYKHSTEVKEAIGKLFKNRTKEAQYKFSKAQLGKNRSDDFKNHASETMKRVWVNRKLAKSETTQIIKQLTEVQGEL